MPHQISKRADFNLTSGEDDRFVPFDDGVLERVVLFRFVMGVKHGSIGKSEDIKALHSSLF